jgi:nitrite reductase/ring-hydroxylating ferredoxin subunit
LDQIPEGRGLAVQVHGKRIALFRVEGEVVALEAACARHAAPLERGVVEEGTLFCPWHGVPFDLQAGVCSEFPDQVAAKRLASRVEGNEVLIDV